MFENQLSRYDFCVDGDGVEVLISAGRFDEAAHFALDRYGPELLGFLAGHLASESDAAEVFAQFTEDLWRGLPAFVGRSSVRTWLYVLARNAASRWRRSPWARAERRTGDDKLDTFVAHARERTPLWRRTTVKDRFRAIRESLDPDDRALLTLRIDRALAWKDIALILDSEAEKLRRRFFDLKDELRERARAAGLIE
jgi:RNA polymerase sigma-70 factor (ECF subfamily)